MSATPAVLTGAGAHARRREPERPGRQRAASPGSAARAASTGALEGVTILELALRYVRRPTAPRCSPTSAPA